MNIHRQKDMLIYALKDEQPVFIDEVENGKKCGCVCPSCGKPLIAYNNGKKNAHSFHHESSDSSCQYGVETSLHWAAKDILSNAKTMTLPPVYVQLPDSDDFLLRPAQEISIDKVELETRVESVIPDVIVYVGKRKFFVEIFVTHAIDDVKLEKLRRQGVSTIEIDLSKWDSISKEELSDILLNDSEEKTWRYNAYALKGLNKYQRSLYVWTKEILLRAKKMTIPPICVIFPWKHEIPLFDGQEIIIGGVELKDNSPVPDIVVYSGTERFFIEFSGTYCEKTVKPPKISVLKINLGKQNRALSKEELAEIVLKNFTQKSWAYHSLADEWFNLFCQISDKRRIIRRKSYRHIAHCPLAIRRWRGRPYANVDLDCAECEYCISIDDDKEELLCSGRERIANIEDFSIPKAERIQKSNESLSRYRYDSFIDNTCPYCGNSLTLIDGEYGPFWGCRSYPHCTFKALVNPVSVVCEGV